MSKNKYPAALVKVVKISESALIEEINKEVRLPPAAIPQGRYNENYEILVRLIEWAGKWECVSIKTFEGQPITYGVGSTPIEAVKDCVEYMKNWNAEPLTSEGFASHVISIFYNRKCVATFATFPENS